MIIIDTNKKENRFIECCNEHRDVSIICKDNEEIGYFSGYIAYGNGIVIEIIEFKKEHRRKGYGKSCIENIMRSYDFICALVTDETSLQFWRKLNPIEELKVNLDIGYMLSKKENEMEDPVIVLFGKNYEKLLEAYKPIL